MPTIRVYKHQHGFVILDTTCLNDTRLSYRARGLHAYLMSKPDNWQVSIAQLEKQSAKEGREAISTALKELLTYKYATRALTRNQHGQLEGYDTIVYEKPQTDNGLAEIGSAEIGLTDFGQSPTNKDCILERIEEGLEEELSSTILFGTGASAIPQAVNGHQDVAALPAKKGKKPKEVKPLTEDDWLRVLLYTYAEHFDVAALDDDDWWANTGNSFPDFTSSWVRLAFADLARWLTDNPKRRPRTKRGWRARMSYSLNRYYDINARRTS